MGDDSIRCHDRLTFYNMPMSVATEKESLVQRSPEHPLCNAIDL